MPIYEYVCRKCNHQFEILVTGAKQPSCPACTSEKLDKQLSVFAANTSGDAGANFSDGAASFGACGTCGDPRGSGSCSLN